MQTNRLLLSEGARADLQRAADAIHGTLQVVGEYEIAIKCSNFDVRIYQPEQYSRLVVGVVAFVDGPSVHWQEVKAALSSGGDAASAAATEHPSDEVAKNDEFLRQLRNSCEKYAQQLLEWPPRWLPSACKIAEQNLAPHFPDIAKQFAQECAAYSRRIGGDC